MDIWMEYIVISYIRGLITDIWQVMGIMFGNYNKGNQCNEIFCLHQEI